MGKFSAMSRQLILTWSSFGAVMEEFEVRDAIDNVFGGKDTMMCE